MYMFSLGGLWPYETQEAVFKRSIFCHWGYQIRLLFPPYKSYSHDFTLHSDEIN